MWIQSLSREDPLQESRATHSSIVARRIPMDRRAQWATVHRAAESETTETAWHTHNWQRSMQVEF